MPPKSANISKFKKTLKNPVLADPNATFNKKTVKASPKSPRSPSRISSKSISPSPRSRSPSRISSKSISPKISVKSRSPSPQASPKAPSSIPGVITEETIEARFVVERPSAERYSNREILKENPKVSMEELSIILGVTKVSLPKINTNIPSLSVPTVRPSSPKSPRRSRSPVRSPVKKACNIMLGDKPIDKTMISAGKKSGGKPVYSMAELKQIASQLSISSTGVKDVVVANILKELEKRGC